MNKQATYVQLKIGGLNKRIFRAWRYDDRTVKKLEKCVNTRQSQFVLTNWGVTMVVEGRKDSELEVGHAVDVEANKEE